MEKKSVLYWVFTVITVLGIFMSGMMNALRADEIAANYRSLGYPLYVMTIIGTAKIIAALVVAAPKLPRLKEWAYAGITICMIGAFSSHLFAEGVTGRAFPPLGVLVVALLSWHFRPASRRLA